MTGRVTVYTEQGKKLILGPQDHLATGGEGSVYAQGSTVYKIYLDPNKAAALRIPEKLAHLKRLQHPGIAAPSGALLDKAGGFVGLEIPRVEGEALCRLYTNTWQDANQFGLDQSKAVTLAMRAIMAHAHAHQAVMVDANELNWLVDGLSPTAIDVDSWQLPGFKGTAIMPSIRDPLAVKSFSADSDWYAWAIVTFQLWCGIHPYKGTHPDFARTALAERMAARASVFDPRVRLPAATRPTSDIPLKLRNWYEQVFASDLRTPPPADWGSAAPQTAPRLKVTQLGGLNASLRQERIGNIGGKALRVMDGFVVVKTARGVQVWDPASKAMLSWVSLAQGELLLKGEAALVRLGPDGVLITLAPGQALQAHTDKGLAGPALPTRAHRLWQSGGRAFALVEGVSNGLVEVSPTVLGDRILLTVAAQWPVAALSTQLLRGCFVQDCLGAPFLGVLENKGLQQLPAPALKGLSVIDGLALDTQNVWLTVVRKADGQTVRLRLSADQGQYRVAEEDVVFVSVLDGARLRSGVGVMRIGETLRVSKGTMSKAVEPCGLSETARLFSLGDSLGLVDDSEVSKLSLG